MARIAVIGAGMGAMAAAARLAVAGHRVTVHERAETYGGGVRRLERDGFGFDTGPGLLHLPAVYRDLFVKTGREPLEARVALSQVDPASAHVFADGTRLALPNASRAGVVAALDAAIGPGAGLRWSDLVNRARDAWDATRRPLLEEPLPADPSPLGRDPYPDPPRRGLLRRRRPASLADVAGYELRDPRLVALLESRVTAYGLDPRTAPPSSAVLAYLEQTFGSWYVGGGIRALADAVYERCRERKVEFSFGSEVVGVLEKDGRATGLELADGGVVEADAVVAGLPPEALPSVASAAGPAPTAAAGAGRLVVCVALRGARPGDAPHRTVVHAPDRAAELTAVFGDGPGWCEAPTVTVLRPDDPSSRPDAGHEAITLSATVAPHGGRVDWSDRAVVERAARRVREVAEAAVPGLADRMVWHEVRTPWDTRAETGAADGAVPAPALAGAGGGLLRPANATRLPGLHLAGGWSHPGGGLAHAGMSGALVAGLIVQGSEWRGSR